MIVVVGRTAAAEHADHDQFGETGGDQHVARTDDLRPDR